MRPPPDGTRKQRRRRFRLASLALSGVLTGVGATPADGAGAAEALGLAGLAQGIGLVVAGASSAIGHDPLDRTDRQRR
jgi:hypothetical protein